MSVCRVVLVTRRSRAEVRHFSSFPLVLEASCCRSTCSFNGRQLALGLALERAPRVSPAGGPRAGPREGVYHGDRVSSCCDTVPQTGWLSTAETCPSVLAAGSLGSRRPQGRAVRWLCGRVRAAHRRSAPGAAPSCLCVLACLSECVSPSCLFMRTPVVLG